MHPAASDIDFADLGSFDRQETRNRHEATSDIGDLPASVPRSIVLSATLVNK